MRNLPEANETGKKEELEMEFHRARLFVVCFHGSENVFARGMWRRKRFFVLKVSIDHRSMMRLFASSLALLKRILNPFQSTHFRR